VFRICEKVSIFLDTLESYGFYAYYKSGVIAYALFIEKQSFILSFRTRRNIRKIFEITFSPNIDVMKKSQMSNTVLRLIH
jgi:hypothetical protein